MRIRAKELRVRRKRVAEKQADARRAVGGVTAPKPVVRPVAVRPASRPTPSGGRDNRDNRDGGGRDNRAPRNDGGNRDGGNRDGGRDNRAPRSDNGALRSDNNAPRNDNRAPRNDGAPRDNNAPRGDRPPRENREPRPAEPSATPQAAPIADATPAIAETAAAAE